MIESFQIMDFLRKTHLFRGLSEEELKVVADKMVKKDFEPGRIIISQAQEADFFYLIYAGQVTVTRKVGNQDKNLANLVTGDYFGEEALLKRSRRTATVTAVEQTTLLTISAQDLNLFLKQFNHLRSKFEVTIASHRLWRSKNFSWLDEGEVVYFITRKHQILLWQAMVWPVLGLLLPVIFLILFLLNPGPLYLWVAAISFLVSLVAIYLTWLDWSNDYYIVTNRRVLYLEKIILIYDSRQEAPLTAILSVNTQSDVMGRTLGYGDVIVRTWVGNIVFKTVGNPEAVEVLLREYWERTKKDTRQADVEEMKLTLRQKLGLEPPSPPVQPPKPATKPAYSFNYFKIRFEEKGIITYRKHWIVWLKQTFLPGSMLILGLVLIIRDFFINGFIRTDYTFPEVVFALLVPIFLWWLYQTIDWSNDKFQVTEDQIFDIDKTPFGRTQKNVAPLENILNMEARREGLLEVIFNYGNVYISVGGAKMVFEDVMNPDDVQQDIDQRRVARKEKQERGRAIADRERLAEFFAAYHNNASALQAEIEEKARRGEPGSKPADSPGSPQK